MPQAPTAHGLPRPAASDKLRDGWDAISDLGDAVDTWLPLLKLKTADESVTNSVALQDDNELWLDLPVGWHEVDVYLAPSGGSVAPDLKMAYTVTAGGVMDCKVRGRLGPELAETTSTATLMTASTTTSLTATASYGMTTGGGFVWEHMLIQVTTAGRLRLQFAQNTLDAAQATTVRAGSYMTSRRVA